MTIEKTKTKAMSNVSSIKLHRTEHYLFTCIKNNDSDKDNDKDIDSDERRCQQ